MGTAGAANPLPIVRLLDSALDPVAKQAIQRPTIDEAEKALLNLKVCDPACGSGHFLIAAAGRLAKYLARLRSGDEEPSTLTVQHAKREIIARCIYGVDMNPMAVELCQVALWMEALEPGKPLSFLKHHVPCGNSLIGATPDMMAKGVTDDAFEAIEGDDKAYCREWKVKNKDDRRGQGRLFDEVAPWEQLGNVAAAIASLDTLPDDTPDQVMAKQQRYEELVNQANYRTSGQFLADVFCAAFFWKKTKAFDYPITEGVFRKVERNPHVITPWMFDEITRLREEFQFFHWHLAFPGVFRPATKGESADNEKTGWCGGFDVVLGNPPWDKLTPDSKEFFSEYDPAVRFANRASERKLAAKLLEDPLVAYKWATHRRLRFAEVRFIKKSGRYRLFAPGNLGKGDFNTYRMFVETALSIVSAEGAVAQIVPEGLYNGANATAIRKEMFESSNLGILYGFENEKEVWFDGIDSRAKFCIYSLRPGGQTDRFRAAFTIRSPERLLSVLGGDNLTIPVQIVREFSPDALSVLEFRSQYDIDIASKMYSRWPKLGDRDAGPPLHSQMREIDMTNDASLFNGDADGIPLYEGRMVGQYDYCAKGYVSGRARAAVWDTLKFGDSRKVITCQWRIRRDQIPEKTAKRVGKYRIGYCWVASPTNERSFIASLLPPNSIAGNAVPTILYPKDSRWMYVPWLAVANSFVMDFLVRMKVSLNLTFTLLKSLPFPRPSEPDEIVRQLAPLVLRLTCTGQEMVGYWNMMAKLGLVEAVPENVIPGILVEEDRLCAKAEIDAIVARDVFSLSREELDYILETFPVYRNYQEQEYGEFRSKRLILEAYDALAEAAKAGQPYRSPFTKRPETHATGSGSRSLAQVTDGQLPEGPFSLVVNVNDVGKGIPKHWRCVKANETDALPLQETWVLVRHSDLKRGNKAVPVALGKLTYKELTDASTKQKVIVVTLRGPVPPAQVRIPLSEWPSFRPLAVLEPLD